MSIELTREQQQALDARAEDPIRVIDPRTQDRYVLVREEVYEKLQGLIAGDRLTEDERRAILRGVWRRAGWDDPAMDDYQALVDRDRP
jgi:hypothetical protein